MTEKKALRVRVEGRVQGVNFRMATVHAAERLGVFGWVMNTPDGAVEALLEGDADKVDAMVRWCREGPPPAAVTNVEVFEEGFTGRLTDFSIRYT